MFSPQHRTEVVDINAQVWAAPKPRTVAPATPDACVGGAVSVTDPSPTWPVEFKPQHRVVPSARTAQVCEPPAATAIAFVRPLAGTGLDLPT